jgi:hypothetical protein
MRDIDNVGGEPADKKPVTEAQTGAASQSEPAEINSGSPDTGEQTEVVPPSAEPRRKRRVEAKQTGEAKKEAAQSPVGGGGKPTSRAKDAKTKRDAAKGLGAQAVKRIKKPRLEPHEPTPEEQRVLDGIIPGLKALGRKDVEAKLALGDLLIQAGVILPRGHFEVWASRHTGLVPRYVRQIRHASEVFLDDLRPQVYASGLGFTCVLALSEAPATVQDDILNKAADGLRYRVADIKAAIQKAKPADVQKAEAEAKAQPKPERPGIAGLRAEVARYTADTTSQLLDELEILKKAVDAALEPYREGRSVKKADLFKKVKATALHALVLQRELMGRKAWMDFPNTYHPLKYPDWPADSRWGDVAKALLTLVELDRHKKSETFGRDLEFDVLEPLSWAISSAKTPLAG